MKRAANILFLVSAILSIVCAVGYIITSIVFFVFAGSGDIVRQLINDGQIAVEPGTDVETLIVAFCAMFGGLGAFMLFAGLCSIAEAIISFKARNSDKKALFVLSIVFSVLGVSVVGAVAGIFGLVKGDTIE